MVRSSDDKCTDEVPGLRNSGTILANGNENSNACERRANTGDKLKLKPAGGTALKKSVTSSSLVDEDGFTLVQNIMSNSGILMVLLHYPSSKVHL